MGNGGGTLNFMGGSAGSLLADAGMTTVSGGALSSLQATKTATVTVTSGTFLDYQYVADTSTVTIKGGTFGGQYFDTSGASTVNISGGTFSNSLDASGMSRVSAGGGSFSGYLYAEGGSVVTVTGGTFGQHYGVNFEDNTTGTLTFVGTGLGAKSIGADPNLGGVDYILTGVLQNGQSVNGQAVNVQPGATMFTLAAAPEPSQVAALGVGILGLSSLTLRARRRARV